MSSEVNVQLGDRSYPIHIGAGVLTAEVLREHVHGSQVAVVTNDVVAPLWLPRLEGALEGLNLKVDVFVLPDGEAEKTLGNYARVIDFLVRHRHNRSTTVIALGGGVVGDLAGFAAATYQRGVALLQIPTTLLSQVDSSVGGKTAVNHAEGKNLIGAFYQPRAVIIDTDMLGTLPLRELKAGLAEVLKYGIIRDDVFFDWVAEHADALLARQPEAITRAISRSCELKAEVVSADEREGGLRAILNYGHTFGHAIETLTGYTEYLHGEAVAIGMVMAADLSRRMALISAVDAERIRSAVGCLGLPEQPPPLDPEAMLRAMGMDKKVQNGTLRLVLCRRLGEAFVTDRIDRDALMETLTAGAGLCGH
jgi:3-dehydroquinate synthase